MTSTGWGGGGSGVHINKGFYEVDIGTRLSAVTPLWIFIIDVFSFHRYKVPRWLKGGVVKGDTVQVEIRFKANVLYFR